MAQRIINIRSKFEIESRNVQDNFTELFGEVQRLRLELNTMKAEMDTLKRNVQKVGKYLS